MTGTWPERSGHRSQPTHNDIGARGHLLQGQETMSTDLPLASGHPLQPQRLATQILILPRYPKKEGSNFALLRKRGLRAEVQTHNFFLIFCLLRATPMAYGGSQSRGLIRATAASLRQSHRNARPKQHLRPTPQLTATRDP